MEKRLTMIDVMLSKGRHEINQILEKFPCVSTEFRVFSPENLITKFLCSQCAIVTASDFFYLVSMLNCSRIENAKVLWNIAFIKR